MSPRAFPDELLQRPMSERLAYFRSYTVAHPQLKAVSEALRRAIQEPGGASLIFVVGPTGVGKTTLRLRIERELKEQFLSAGEPEPGRIPVVGFEAAAPDSGNFSWKDYYRRALGALEEPLINYKLNHPTSGSCRDKSGEWNGSSRVCSPELRQALEQALRHRRPAAVLIDEAQHFTKIASGRRLSDQLDCLKSLASLTGCVHVLIGTYELLPCRNLSAQLSRRSLDIHFRRYRVDNPDDVIAFQRVIFSFQRHLPLAEEPELWRDWEFCYTHSLVCRNPQRLVCARTGRRSRTGRSHTDTGGFGRLCLVARSMHDHSTGHLGRGIRVHSKTRNGQPSPGTAGARIDELRGHRKASQPICANDPTA